MFSLEREQVRHDQRHREELEAALQPGPRQGGVRQEPRNVQVSSPIYTQEKTLKRKKPYGGKIWIVFFFFLGGGVP